MFSLETLKKLNVEAEAREASSRAEKKLILENIESAKSVEDLKNILIYVVDHYVLRVEERTHICNGADRCHDKTC